MRKSIEETTHVQPTAKALPLDESLTDGEKGVSDWKKPKLGVKLFYATPFFAIAAMSAPFVVELKIFYTDTVLVPAGLLALAMAIARALDAVTDPVMGWITDHTRSRWGRRKPWILVGLPFGLFFFWLMFSPPESLSRKAGPYSGPERHSASTIFSIPSGSSLTTLSDSS